jgi:hypothetical protein
MPESRSRKRPAYTPPPAPARVTKKAPSPPWVGITILSLFAVGIAYLVTYYISNGGIVGQRSLGGWNIFVGFAFIVAGFGMLTQWR